MLEPGWKIFAFMQEIREGVASWCGCGARAEHAAAIRAESGVAMQGQVEES